MGGSGSGGGFRRIAEQCQRIDIRQWRRWGYLQGIHWFRLSWTRGNEPSGSVSVSVNLDSVRLDYRLVDTDESVAQRIERRRVQCRFGGWRHYFACAHCWRSAEVLYLARGRFRCRKCARIGYAIENLDRQWRADRRYRQLETRLNEDGSKPRRMRWRTYDRLCERLALYGQISESGLVRLLAKYGLGS